MERGFNFNDMEKGYKYSEEARASRRRKLRAKRLWKKLPMFAFQTLLQDNPDYTINQFSQDIIFRKKIKERKSKSNLERYGRYWKYRELLNLYLSTRNEEYYFAAKRLRDNMTKPYRVSIKYAGESGKEFSFDATIKYEAIQEIVRLSKTCKSIQEFEDKLKEHTDKSKMYFGL